MSVKEEPTPIQTTKDDGGYEPVQTDANDVATVIREFEAAFPGWWWSVTHCVLTRDADCGPDARVLGFLHPHVKAFDDGFHEAHDGTLADALRSVMQMAMAAVQDV